MRSHTSAGRVTGGLVLLLAFLAAAPVEARPVGVDRPDRVAHGGSTAPLPGRIANGNLSSAQTDTVWFGGTRWDAVDGRWEAVQDSCWTFDSGVGSHFDFSDPDVNPFKDTSLHARMEGWIGIDFTYETPLPYFRRLDTSSDWEGGTSCVGSPAGLGGAWSFWAGVLDGEGTALCYATGQGYGNSWDMSLVRTFEVTPNTPSTFSFNYRVETEPGYDFAFAEIDTGGGIFQTIWSRSGNESGTAVLGLSPGSTYPVSGTEVRIRLRVSSDALYSDEDGNQATACGAFAADDLAFTGGATYSTDLEIDDGGWSPQADSPPGEGGEWSNLVDLASLPPMLSVCECSLTDSVLVFEDLSVGGHGQYQENVAASPWVDLAEAGAVGYPGKVVSAEVYADLPLLNYVFTYVLAQWSPTQCAAGGTPDASPWTSTGFGHYFGGVPTCRGSDDPYLLDFSGFVDLSAERVRVAVGMIAYCSFFAQCTGITNSTPWFDNVRFGVFGTSGAPFLTTQAIDLPQDSWPQAGSRIDVPGRIDQAGIQGANSPQPGTSRGDTLVVRGGSGGAEVRVQFAVRPGPETDTTAVQAWLASHDHEGNWLGLDWYSARMDTALGGNLSTPNTWATLYHEDDPNFSGNQLAPDPTDLDPAGQQTRKLNDIFPDDLFTAGSRIMLFYKAIHDGSEEPYTGLWYVHPDTSGGEYLEMEILPSSATPIGGSGSTWNCILYVNHDDDPEARERMESGLAAVVSGGSDNHESTPWDRFDVRAPSSGDVALGSPPNTQYGVGLDMLLGYNVIVWDSGENSRWNLTDEDAAVLAPWLTLTGAPGLGFRNLYLSGDDLASSVGDGYATDPEAKAFLETHLGVSWTCDTIRDASCPGSPAIQDTVACIQVDPTGSPFPGNSGPDAVVLRGNGCPELRSFDVITTAAGANGSPVGNEIYDTLAKGPVSFHSVANEVWGGPDYKSVVDGASVSARRSALDCTDPSAVADRLERVLGWFGYAGPGQSCTAAETCFYLGAASINVPAPALCVLPNVLLGAPEDAFPSRLINTITVNGCTGPVIGSYVEIRFSPEADSLISWGPGQSHPIISGVTDGNGEFSPPIIAGGCIPSGLYIPGPAATIYADGIKLGELSFTSFDMVNAAGYVPGSPGWTPNCGVTTSLADATFYGSGSPSSCYDFNGDGTPADAFDNYWFDQMMGKTTCSVTGSPEPALVDALRPAAPNPFRGATRFALSLTEPSPVRFVVYDVTGRVVRTLADGTLPAGVNDLGWDGRDETGAPVGAGLYFYRLVSPRVRETGKLVLLR